MKRMQRSHVQSKTVGQVRGSLVCFTLFSLLLPCCHPAQAKPYKPNLKPPLSAQLDKSASAKQTASKPPIKTAEVTAAGKRARELLEAGTKLHNSGHHDQAEQLFKQAIAVDPKNAADGFFNLGAIAEGRGDFVGALGHYRAGLAMRSDDNDLKEAVTAMEAKLTSSGDAFVHPPRAYTAPIGTPDIPVLNVETPQFTSQNAYPPPLANAPVTQSAGAFQLHSSMNTGFTPYSNPPLLPQAGQYGQQPQNPPLQGNASRGLPSAAMRTVIQVGAGVALRRSGLHCPLCHIFGIPLGF